MVRVDVGTATGNESKNPFGSHGDDSTSGKGVGDQPRVASKGSVASTSFGDQPRISSKGSAASTSHGDQPRMASKGSVAFTSFTARLWSQVTCLRRRQAWKLASDKRRKNDEYTRYREFVLRGRHLSEERRKAYAKMAYWTDARTKDTSALAFVFAPRGFNGNLHDYVDMDELLAYTVAQLHEKVVTSGKTYAVVWVMCTDPRIGLWGARRLKQTVLPKYGELLDSIHVVHPTWPIRILRLVLWPLVSEEFWDHFLCHERVEFLSSDFDIEKLRLLEDVCEYDKVLDREAEQIAEQTRQQLGQQGFMGMGMGGMTGNNANFAPGGKDASFEELEKLLKSAREREDEGGAKKEK
eukprot:TRINITY_DN494_c0_g1_i1.p1 TRINITY_DN494_c0_g1~~TRINITY_DN494_c0_g1_i1.p1  ORF type:complete len:387 (+),score=66.77 TRINITY_DN494_c0_g1_i1:105-1163(+)